MNCALGKDVESYMSTIPSVKPIRPKAHWIYDKSFDNWRCSKCGETPKTMGYVGTDTFMAEHFKYCNHCGAEMESEDK
jgi:ribosomal protein S27AE